MAVHFAAGANYGQRTAGGFLNPASSSTVMMWVKYGSVPANPDYQTAYILMDDPGVYVQFAGIFARDTFHRFHADALIDDAPAPVAGQWYHICWVQVGTSNQLFYVNGTKIDGTGVESRAAWTIGFEFLGNDTFSTGDLTLQYFRSWQRNLTTDQIRTEMQSATVVDNTLLFMDTPLTSDLLDISGNGRDWTLVGSDSFVTGPTLPSNSSAATATAIDPSSSLTQDFQDGMYSWFSYTGVPSDLIVSFWPFASLSDTLTTTCYYGSPGSLTTFSQGINVPMEVPTSNADTFYFMVMSSPGQPSTDVVIEGNLRPEETVPLGSIAVNDDGNFDVNGLALPAAFLSVTDGHTLAFAAAAAGEQGTVLPPTGVVCLYNVGTGDVMLYPPGLGTATATVNEDDFSGSGGLVIGIGTDNLTQFYIGYLHTGNHVKTLSPTGVIGTTDYVVAVNPDILEANRDNTILYYATDATGGAVKRWDLVNNLALSDLAAGVANHRIVADLLVLADDTIIVGYDKPGAPTDWFVRRYDPSGAILNTYTFGATNRVNRMAMAINDPTTFWVWLYLNDDPGTAYGGGVSNFVEVDVATGATITSVTAPNFEAGVNRAEPTTDPTRLGHSFSCPFWIARTSITPPGPGAPEEFLIRRERWFPVLNQENQRMTFSMLQVDLQAGNGLTEGQGENPLLELDWSDDAGWTWSNLRFLPTGRVGQYNRRAIARVLGQSRQRVFRIAVSDPCQWIVLDGYMQLKGGTS